MTRERISAWLVVFGSLAGGLGWWLPWVAHPKGAAALVLLGLDLGEGRKPTVDFEGEGDLFASISKKREGNPFSRFVNWAKQLF